VKVGRARIHRLRKEVVEVSAVHGPAI
jgi:hypothetical protein